MDTKLILCLLVVALYVAIIVIVASHYNATHYNATIEEIPSVTFDSQWMESFVEENGEDVIYWEIDFIGRTPCRKYEYTTYERTTIHIYYECEKYCSGFYVHMNPQTGRCTIWEDGH